jgi:phosphatidylglycerophosphatase C
VVERTPLTLSPDKLVAELDALLGDGDPSGAVLAFDGDGTLWSGDVGEDLFHGALSESFLVDAAYPALVAEAKQHHIPLGPAESTANALASVLFASYLAGQYPERETCAMMTWCYAGRRLDEVQRLAARVLEQTQLNGRLTQELAPVIEWSRSAGVRRVLISASPRAIVEPAAARWGFEPRDIAAATPSVVNGVVQPRLDGAVPYAEAKLTAGKALFGSARWLGAFGDNVFDIDMLTTAELGVAVRPKPKLATELAALGLRLLAAAPNVSTHVRAPDVTPLT